MAKDAEEKAKKAKKEKKRLEASGATEGVATLTVDSDLVRHDVEMLDGEAKVVQTVEKVCSVALSPSWCHLIVISSLGLVKKQRSCYNFS